jgi:PAS domain S-box-containing protein
VTISKPAEGVSSPGHAEGACVVDREGVIVSLDAACAALLQQEAAACVGRPLEAFVAGDARDRLRTILRDALPADGATLVARPAQGRLEPLHLRFAALQGGGGSAGILVRLAPAAARDVLRRREAMLARTERIAAVGSWEWDIERDELFWSDALYRLLAVDPAEGPPPFDSNAFYTDDEFERIRRVVGHALRTREPFEIELRARRRDGAERTFLARGEYLPPADDAGPRLVGSYQDLTAQRLAESDRDRFRRAIEQSGDMILICDAQGRIEFANPAAERGLGAPAGVLRALDVHELLHRGPEGDDAQDRQLEALQAALAEDRSWQGRLSVLGLGGRRFVAELSLSPVADAAGQRCNLILAARDVSLELDLARQVEQAQKLESIGRLAGGIAHDFNNMLQAILGNTELALTEFGEQGELRELLEEIRAAAAHSAELTMQLLAFAREQRIEPVDLDLATLVPRTLGMLRRALGADVTLAFVEAPSPLRVHMDPTQLDQILTNLCVNARDALGGAGRIEVSVDELFLEPEGAGPADCAPGPYVRLRVQDEGCGIAEDALPHIFEPFFTTKPVGHGTGLGLATVYGIVRQNRGGVELHSRPGEGTRVDIYLPAAS